MKRSRAAFIQQRFGALLFVGLALCASAERKLAQLDIGWPTAPTFENAEQPSGDQIAIRLAAINDCTLPEPPGEDAPVLIGLGSLCPRTHPLSVVQLADPRAPPRSLR